MTLKELLDKVSELCNEETKDLKVIHLVYGDAYEIMEIWRCKLKNDYIEVDEIRLS